MAAGSAEPAGNAATGDDKIAVPATPDIAVGGTGNAIETLASSAATLARRSASAEVIKTGDLSEHEVIE